MKDILAGILVFLLVGSLYIVVSEKRHDNFNEIPSGSVILDVDDNFLYHQLKFHKSEARNPEELLFLIFPDIEIVKLLSQAKQKPPNATD